MTKFCNDVKSSFIYIISYYIVYLLFAVLVRVLICITHRYDTVVPAFSDHKFSQKYTTLKCRYVILKM